MTFRDRAVQEVGQEVIIEVWNLNRVEIRVATGNLRSAAIPKRLGFTEEGVLRQAERHGDTFKDVAVHAMLMQNFDP